jgi:DNA-binding CsgD family transcriptional regulator
MDDDHTQPAHDDERLHRVAAAFQDGVVLVDARGSVVWVDRAGRRHVDGQLRELVLPLVRSDTESVDCFISPVELTVDGHRVRVGVIQETAVQRYGTDLIAAIESVFADSTSWFARTVIEKLRTMSPARPGPRGNGSAQLSSLSDRERDVLGLICEGRSDVEMADLLGLSENTVRNHIASLYRKIGVNRRPAAVIWARERGITCRNDVLAGHRERPGHRRGNGKSNGNGSDNNNSGKTNGGTLSY